MESQYVESCTGFSVDFSRTVITESYVFLFSREKLPLEALGSSVSQLFNSGTFWQKGRLGPPESEHRLDPGWLSWMFPEKWVQKQ